MENISSILLSIRQAVSKFDRQREGALRSISLNHSEEIAGMRIHELANASGVANSGDWLSLLQISRIQWLFRV